MAGGRAAAVEVAGGRPGQRQARLVAEWIRVGCVPPPHALPHVPCARTHRPTRSPTSFFRHYHGKDDAPSHTTTTMLAP